MYMAVKAKMRWKAPQCRESASRSRYPDQAPPSASPWSERRQDLERLTYLNYLARLEASKRLSKMDSFWTTSLSVASATLVMTSVASLTYRDRLGTATSFANTALSIAILVMTLIATNASYARRSRDMFYNYRALQQLSRTTQLLAEDDGNAAMSLANLEREYQGLLDSENHETRDYMSAIRSLKDRGQTRVCGQEMSEIKTPKSPLYIRCGPQTLVATFMFTALAVPIIDFFR